MFIPKGIMPSFEHLEVLGKIDKLNSLIDCGSNKGQFALIVYSKFKIKNYISFDPIFFPLEVNKYLYKNNVKLIHESVALSSQIGKENFFITERKDSSSLKETIEESSYYCPDVFYKEKKLVKVRTLDSYLGKIKKLQKPIAIKIDVQGSELELLLGASESTQLIDFLFIEISFESLYKNTASENNIFSLLNKYGFEEVCCYNSFTRRGKTLSKDYFFKKSDITLL